MGNYFCAVALLAFCFATFRYSTTFMAAQRAFYGLLGTLGLSSVNVLDDNGKPCDPYFSTELLDLEVQSYLEERLGKQCQYRYTVQGINWPDKSECTRYPKAVAVHLDCSLYSGKSLLSKTAYAYLEERP